MPRGHPAVLATLVSGAGKTAAAVAVTRRLARLPETAGIRVLNIGTAGGLRDDCPELVRPSQAWAWDLDAQSLTALGIPVEDRLPLESGDGPVIATGDTLVAAEELREVLRRQACVVDMECFAVVSACRSFGVPVQSLKWISDRAAAAAARRWVGSVDRGAQVIGEATRTLLDGAPATALL